MTRIPELLDAYQDFLQHELQRSQLTVYAYLSDLRSLAKALDKPVAEITKNDLRAYMRELGKRGRSRATVRRQINGMSTFWKWMMDEGYVSANVTAGIVLPKRERKFARWLSEAELRRFVNTFDPNPRNALAWALLAWLGVRRNELRGLRCGDVDFEDGMIAIRGAKSSKDRTLPIPAALTDRLRAVCDGHQDADFLLPGEGRGYWSQNSFYAAFRAHAQAAGLTGITPHTLRHTFATHMSQRGVPLRIIQQWLGHERIDTTGIYMQVAPEFMVFAMDKHVLNG